MTIRPGIVVIQRVCNANRRGASIQWAQIQLEVLPMDEEIREEDVEIREDEWFDVMREWFDPQ